MAKEPRGYYFPEGPWRLVVEFLMRDARQAMFRRRVLARIKSCSRSIVGFCDMSSSQQFCVKHYYVLTTPVNAILLEDICAERSQSQSQLWCL